MATTEELQARLDEAETTYHEWCIGKSARRFRDSNGEEIEYSVEGLRRLQAYILDLKRQIDPTTCIGPMRPMFR